MRILGATCRALGLCTARRPISSARQIALPPFARNPCRSLGNPNLLPIGSRSASTYAARKEKRDSDNSGSSSSSGQDKPEICKFDIRLPWAKRMPKIAFLLTNVFSPDECKRFINITEQIGYQQRDECESGGSLCLWRSFEEASLILKNIQPYVPDTWWEGTRLSALDEILQFERYGPQQALKARRDGAYVREDGDRSYLTFLLFLNDIEDGGHTGLVSPPVCFPAVKSEGQNEAQPVERVNVAPKAGSMLVFQNDIFYDSLAHDWNTKYILKGELLYTTKPAKSDSSMKTVTGFFSGKPTSLVDKSDVIKPTTWFFPDNSKTANAKSPPPTGIPFYVPQKKKFIYV